MKLLIAAAVGLAAGYLFRRPCPNPATLDGEALIARDRRDAALWATYDPAFDWGPSDDIEWSYSFT